jgi:hypothetical protein
MAARMAEKLNLSEIKRMLTQCSKEELLELLVETVKISKDARTYISVKLEGEGAVENQIASNANNEYRKYSNEALLQILFQFVQDYGSREEAERFVHEHLPFTFFREWAIKKSMASRDYRRAIELSEEGERQDKQFPGLLSKWKAARYEAYKRLSLRQEQGLLAKELLLGGDYTYYPDLESLIILQLKAQYNRRPTFLDELAKLT